MAVTVAVTQVSSNTSLGTQDITTTDLAGQTPKAALFSMCHGTANGTAVDDTIFCIGVTDGTQSFSFAFNSDHGVTTTDTAKRAVADCVVISNATDQTVEARGEFSSFITNGIRINWPSGEVPASAFLINVTFFAGDISANVGNIAAPTTVSGTVDITSIGFEPEIVFGFYHAQISGTADSTGGHIRGSWGIAVNQGGVTQRSMGYQDRNGVTTSDTRSNMSELYMCRTVANTGANYEMGLSAGSFDSNGFTIEAVDGARTDTDFYWLALKLDGATSVSLSTHSTKSGTTGELADTTPGFKPQALIVGTTMAEAVDTISVAQTIGGALGIGMVDSDDIYSTSLGSEGGVTTSNTQSLTDDSINLPNQDGSAGVEAVIPSGGVFQDTGFTFDYSAVETNAKKWFVLAIGESGGTIPMGRMYTLTGSVSGATTAIDLLRVSAPTDAVVVVHRIHITQETEFGDAESEQIDIIVARASTDGSGGSTVTAAKLESGDAAFGGSAVSGNSTQSTLTTPHIINETFPVQAGFYWVPTPEEKIVLSPSGRLVVELSTAPNDSIDFRFFMVIEEIGG
jgi:hypothetical protein